MNNSLVSFCVIQDPAEYQTGDDRDDLSDKSNVPNLFIMTLQCRMSAVYCILLRTEYSMHLAIGTARSDLST